MRTWSLKARLVVPVVSPPIVGGVIDIAGERIVGVRSSGYADLDLGDAAVVPGLVNAHTHLDLSDCIQPLPVDGGFADWIGSVIRHRRRSDADPVSAVKLGIAELMDTATTLVGDISADSASDELLEHAPIDAVVYREVIGVNDGRAESSWNDFARWLAARTTKARILAGVSPHAPYSTHLELMSRTGASGLPSQIHFAETPEELLFLKERSGPLAEMLANLGVGDTSGLATSFNEILERMPGVTLAHANSVSEGFLIAHSSHPLVHCPATHTWFGRSPFPLARLLASGMIVGLGTDSRASSPEINMGQHLGPLLDTHRDLSPAEVLACGTRHGAKALGQERDHGAIAPGMLANLAVVSHSEKGVSALEGVIWNLGHPLGVLWRGEWRKINRLANASVTWHD